MVSKEVEGLPLDTHLFRQTFDIQNVDMRHFSKLIIATIASNPKDGSPLNFVLESKSNRLFCVDNDHVFTEPIKEVEDFNLSFRKFIPNVKSILFGLSPIGGSLEPSAVSDFCTIPVESVIYIWIKTLNLQTAEYFRILTLRELKMLYHGILIKKKQGSISRERVIVPTFFAAGAVSQVYHKVKQMRSLLHQNPSVRNL